jgi:hypothetical protein
MTARCSTYDIDIDNGDANAHRACRENPTVSEESDLADSSMRMVKLSNGWSMNEKWTGISIFCTAKA